MGNKSAKLLKSDNMAAKEAGISRLGKAYARHENEVVTKSFYGANGATEHFLSITAPAGLSFEKQMKIVESRYAEAVKALGLAPKTAIFRRIFLSDVLNQQALLQESDLATSSPDNPVAVSIVQQPPLPGAKIALLAYHAAGGTGPKKQRLSPHHLIVEQEGHRHLWTTGLCVGSKNGQDTAAAQTRAIFESLIEALAGQGAALRHHCVRTWIYLKDVDIFYQGMVDSRRELFARQGLTADTHYIASTGIEGSCQNQFDLVSMDALSILDLAPEQVSYLNDFRRLCPTKDYNVTFERGTRIAYADRAHCFISGTASIDNAGKIVHPGDVVSQLDRALKNIDALLYSGGACIDDMMHMIVYLRDPADFKSVDDHFRARFPDIPYVIVQGSVCRPGWLVEVEGLAISPHSDPSLPKFMKG